MDHLKQRIRDEVETVTPDVLSGVTKIEVVNGCVQNYESSY
jgi:hypothetical protein